MRCPSDYRFVKVDGPKTYCEMIEPPKRSHFRFSAQQKSRVAVRVAA